MFLFKLIDWVWFCYEFPKLKLLIFLGAILIKNIKFPNFQINFEPYIKACNW